MAELVQKIAAERADVPALVDEYGTTTWGELDRRVDRLVNGLRDRGLSTHDTIALVCGNRREFFEVFLAAAHGGWVVVPVNWHWVADELAYVIENSGATAVIVDDRFLDVSVQARADGRTGAVHTWVAMGDATPDGFAGYEALLAAAPPEPADGHARWAARCSTRRAPPGSPRGCGPPCPPPACRRRLLELISASFTDMLGLPVGGVDPAGRARLPLGAVGVLDVPAARAAPPWSCSTGSTPPRRCELIDRHGVTNVHLVPTQFIRLLRLPDEVRAALRRRRRLQAVHHGAAPCPAQVKRQMLEWWGPMVSEYYGGTEGGFISLITGEEWLARPGSLGRPLAIIEVLGPGRRRRSRCPRARRARSGSESRLGSDFEYHGDPDKTAERPPGAADGARSATSATSTTTATCSCRTARST